MVWTKAKALREMGYDVHFYYIGINKGFFYDEKRVEESRKIWGEKLNVFKDYRKNLFMAPVHPCSFVQRVRQKILFTFKANRFYTNDVDDFYDPAMNVHLLELHQKENFDVAYVNYVFFSKALEIFPESVLKIIDTHDIFGNRHKAFQERGLSNSWFSLTPKSEIKGLNRADIVVAVQENEADYLKQKIKPKVSVIGPLLKDFGQLTEAPFKHSVLYVAHNTKSNLNAFNFFFDEVFPKMRPEFPDLKIFLAGQICEVVEDHEAIEKLGRVEELKDAYEKAAIVINPVLIGTGIKIKTLEALSFGKPLVTTSVGADGLEDGIDSAFLADDTPEGFTDKLSGLMKNSAAQADLGKRGNVYFKKYTAQHLETLRLCMERF